MTNGNRIRSLNDLELALFIRACKRDEIKYEQSNCKECLKVQTVSETGLMPCTQCMYDWIRKEE